MLTLRTNCERGSRSLRASPFACAQTSGCICRVPSSARSPVASLPHDATNKTEAGLVVAVPFPRRVEGVERVQMAPATG